MLYRTMAVALCGVLTASLFPSVSVEAAAKKAPKKPVITVSKPVPDAREVDLFEAIEAGDIEAKVVPKDQFGAKVFIENKTDEPLNIKFPKAVVAAPILAQFGGMGGGMGGMGGGMGGMGGMGGGMMGGGGGGQMMGGGMGGMGGGMGGMGGGMGGMGGGMGGMGGMGGGGGFFSVPPEKVVAVNLNTICLEHGKPDPTSGMKYKLVPVDRVTKNGTLTQLLTMVGTGKLDKQSAQAAAWHLTDRMSWNDLASKEQEQLGGVTESYFSREQLMAAQQILAMAAQRAEKSNKSDEEEEEKPADKPIRSPRVSQLKK